MSPRRAARLAAPILALAAAAWAPQSVLGHAIGGTYTLPVPLWLYLAGAAIAVAA